MEVTYENLIADPALAFESILQFCQLEYPAEFRTAVKRFAVNDRNYKWREELTPRQQAMLEDCLHHHLVRYGYKPLDRRIPAQRNEKRSVRAGSLQQDP
jgi:hypothetical protein